VRIVLSSVNNAVFALDFGSHKAFSMDETAARLGVR